jgi:hypothetical protein
MDTRTVDLSSGDWATQTDVRVVPGWPSHRLRIIRDADATLQQGCGRVVTIAEERALLIAEAQRLAFSPPPSGEYDAWLPDGMRWVWCPESFLRSFSS